MYHSLRPLAAAGIPALSGKQGYVGAPPPSLSLREQGSSKTLTPTLSLKGRGSIRAERQAFEDLKESMDICG